jgi:hypothetical protein
MLLRIFESGPHKRGLQETTSNHFTFYHFLDSIGLPLSGPCLLFEDNQGTIKLICTNRLTDTVLHHDVKLAWLNENFLTGTFDVAYTKSTLMLVDCNTKAVNGSQLFTQISFSIGQHFYPSLSLQHTMILI